MKTFEQCPTISVHLIFLLLLLIDIGMADNFHIVASGPCLKKGKNYCQNIVPNSFCSQEKNECFCQHGFVAIKEKNGLICKTLLTDLKCSTDRDCKDVYGSSCHPGPGQCSCPAETFYVAQEHVCKDYPKNIPDPLCKLCRNIGGKCYFNTISPLSVIPKQNIYSGKCNCPGILSSPAVTNEKSQLILSLDICQGIMVDLGSYCNDHDIICRTKIAECAYSTVMKYKVCVCPKDYIAVYQHYLKYYECYPKIERLTKFCEHCQNSQGSCIDVNSDGNEDSCYCGKWKTISNQEDTEFSQPFCRDDLLIIKCSSVHLEVCINNDKYNPKKRLAISEYSTGIFYTNMASKSTNFCSVTGLKKSKSLTCFQMSKPIQSSSFENNCSIISFGQDNSVYYSTFLFIPKDKFIFDPINDFNYDISCKADFKRSNPSMGQITEKSWKGEINSIEPLIETIEDLLSFKLVDFQSKTLKEVKIEQMFALDVYMKRRNVKFNYLLPEKCSLINGKSNQIIYSRIKSISLSPSPNQNELNMFAFSMTPKVDQNEPYKLRSNFFPAFMLKSKGISTFSCVFRLCQDSSMCNQNFEWKNLNKAEIKIPTSHDDIKFVESHLDFFIGDENCCTRTSVAKENKVPCSDSLCLTPAQILTIVISVCTLTILLSFIVIILFKKRNRTKYSDKNAKPNVEQSDFYELSILKPHQSTFQRFSIEDMEGENSNIYVSNKFTDDQYTERLNPTQHDVTLAKEYDFYVNLSALNFANRPGPSAPISLLNRSRVNADISSDPVNILENHCTLLDSQPPYHIQHHICTFDKVKSSKCSKSTAV